MLPFRSLGWLAVAGASLILAAEVFASGGDSGGVGDPTLRTDHPQYAGEGAFQTVEDCAAFAARQAQTPQDRAVAMYLWLLTHQWHLHSPQEPLLPGLQPDTNWTAPLRRYCSA